jgi:transmembrane sensor
MRRLPESCVLADGSVVELRPGAESAVDFGGSLRGVTLIRGEAHFQVARDKDRPFVVAAGGVDFQALGTAFSVQLGSTRVELLVDEGRVAVEKPSDIGPTGQRSAGPAVSARMIATVDAGKRMVVELFPATNSVPSTPMAVPSQELAERLAWRAPRLEFSGTLLTEAAALMNQHNPVQLVVGDPALDGVRVTGLFRADNTDTFVRLLEASFGIKAERSGNVIILRKSH